MKSLGLFLGLFFTLNGSVAQKIELITFTEFEKQFLNTKEEKFVINFWATWCKPCVKELPFFEKVYERNTDPNIKFILISLDDPKLIKKKLISFLKKNKIQIPCVVLDDNRYNDWIPKVDSDWSGAIPATLVVHGRKKIFVEKIFENPEELSYFIKKSFQILKN